MRPSDSSTSVVVPLRRLIAALGGREGSDEELVSLFVATGDEAAFGTLVRRYGGMVLDVARCVLRNEADAEDVFHLTHYELESAIVDLMTSWSTASPPRGPHHWPKVVAERRAAIAEWAKQETPPALGPVPEAINDPAIVMLWGITSETLDTWLNEGSTPSNEVRGFAASSGIVEGPARIVKSVEEIGRLQQGDILVCQVTNPTWAPVFQKISGAVSDIGGSMSHAAIVAREYGLPAVVGTGTATSRIKDGQRIRVDGGRGVVTIL